MASPIARRLRKTPTDAEKRLWSRLREKQLGGFRFRRQHPIDNFVVDFFCPDAKLVVEVDGGQHDDNAARDQVRTRWLESKGYQVIRFWNNDVLGNTEGVLERILEALRAGPPTPPSPSRGEGDQIRHHKLLSSSSCLCGETLPPCLSAPTSSRS